MIVHTMCAPAICRNADGDAVKVRMSDTRAKLWRKPRKRHLTFTRVYRGDPAKARLVADLLTRHYAMRHLRPVVIKLRVVA